MSAETKIPSIPAVTQTNLTEVARAVKGILDVREGRAGDKLDANVTFRDLVDVGIARVATGAATAGGRTVVPAGPSAPSGYDPAVDMTPPPQPTGLTASSSFTSITLQWDVPAYQNHAYTEVWASGADVIGNATMIGTSVSSLYVDAVGEPSFERYYWIRFVSQADVEGPYNGTAGVYAKTAIDVSGALTALAGQIRESELSQALGTRISLVDAPSTTPGSVAYQVAQEASARQTIDGALASQITTLSATVDGNAASLQQEITTRASETGGLLAQYTVKTDIAGHVAGFGLASTASNAAPTSSFIVQADQFAVAPAAISSASAPATNLFKGKVWVDTSVVPSVTRYYTGSAWSTTPQALPFVVQTSPTTLNGVAVLPGVYIPDAYLMNGSIGNAKIGNAAIDDAKVANLSAAKLTAGDGTIGGTLKSENYAPGSVGWAVFKNGNAEFSNATVRGTVYANAGSIGGILMGANNIRSSNFTDGAAGFMFNADGSARIGKGMTLDASGNVTFSGALSAATGTFSGSLDVKSAAAGARMEIKNSVIKVFDASGNLRVKIGDLSA